MRGRLIVLAVLAVVLLSACGSDSPQSAARQAPSDGATPTATTAQSGVRLVRVAEFDSPVLVTAPPRDRRRIFVVEQGGRIMEVRGGNKLARPFLDITRLVTSGGEQGLLGLAFAPDYATSRRFYVYYTGLSGRQNVVEYRAASADRADPASARPVLRMADPAPNHNGGNLVFGPDGLLYIGTGDGGGSDDQHGSRGNAQSLGSLLGKILRIDPRRAGDRAYTVPASNPFVRRAGARGEIYAYGLRNPWRFSFDRRTGALTIGDVGESSVEEIDFARRGAAKGANYGWRAWEGRERNFQQPAPGAVFPVITHSHDAGFCSITGGFVSRDPRVPALAGRYVYSDFCDGRIRAARLSAGRARDRRVLGVRRVSSVSSFGEDAAGRIYVTSLDGPVYRFASR